MNRKSIAILLCIMLALTLVVAGCGPKEPAADDEVKDAITVAQGADAKSLDPHGTNDQPSSRVSRQIYNTLVKTTEDMEIAPALAEDWEQDDPVTWVFNIREGVMFHNGEELKASDVKFTLDRMKEAAIVSHIVAAIESVETDGDYKVIIKTEYPFAPLLAHLAHTASSIVNEKAVTELGDNYGQNPVGTGPFKFVQWDAGDKIVLERFDDYWEGPAKIKTITFRNIPEGTNRAIGLETGEFDIAYDLEVIDKERVEGNEDLQYVEEPSLSMTYIGFNCEKKPLDSKLVRRAICHAIDADVLISTVLEGSGERAKAPVSEKVFGVNTELEPYEYNPEKAKELLKEAGYEDGFSTIIWTNENPERVQVAQIVQAQLKEVGIDLKIDVLEWGGYLDRTAAGEHDMFILGWVTVTADSDYGLYPLFHSSQHGDPGNRSFYTHERVDELLAKGRTSIDFDERLEAYKEAQEIIADEAPVLILYYKSQNYGAQKDVQGFRLHPAGHHSLYPVYFE